MPETDPKELYLDLLKKSLTDYLHIENEHANAMPIEFTNRSTLWRRTSKDFLRWVMRKLRYRVASLNRSSVEERRNKRELGQDRPPLGETMIGLRQLDNLQILIQVILKEKVQGDFIETGVWRGGATIFMQGVLRALDVHDRKIWVCDSFEGLPPPEPDKFPEDEGDQHHKVDLLAVSLEIVRENFRKYGLLDDNIIFVKGFFDETLPNLEIGDISLLRMDGDMYGSSMVTLDSLYDKVVPGGFIIVDDYMVVSGCRSAIDDFRKEHSITSTLQPIDNTAVYWRKNF